MIPKAQEAGGAELAKRLQAPLRQRFRSVRIDVQNGGLVLRGRVHTYYMKQVAQELVMSMTEVPILANEIEVD